MADEKAPATRAGKGGLLVILGMGLIFLFLLVGLVMVGSRRPPVSANTEHTFYVIVPKLRIRTQPQAKAPVLSTVDREAKVEIVEDGGIWVKIRTSDEVTGWAERSDIAGQKEYERRMARARAISKLPALDGFVTERTALYAGPGVFFPVIGQLAAETKVNVFTRDHEFYAIAYTGMIAYAEVDAIDLAPQAQEELEIAYQGEQSDASAAPQTASAAGETGDVPAKPISGWVPQTATPDPIGVYPAVPPGGTQPQVVSRVNPSYPRSARENSIEGVVVIRAIVRKDGQVDEVEVLRDLPYGLGDAAKAAVKQWRFTPATYNGAPIDVYYTVTVKFRLR
jgi:TonB family protein